jgi:hypothetical protein
MVFVGCEMGITSGVALLGSMVGVSADFGTNTLHASMIMIPVMEMDIFPHLLGCCDMVTSRFYR